MSTVAMSGSDTIIINDRIFSDLADQDVAMLEFPNDIANLSTGKNGNSIYGLNESGRQAELTLRVVRGSGDDKFLLNLLIQQEANFAAFPLMFGELIKQLGDGQGNVSNDTYILIGGVFQKEVAAKSNVQGETDQSLSIYKMKFAKATRVIT